ncbi:MULTISPECIES: BTAD domain-containing putative transcriptional regulator [unclassified Nocardioides]|uniref:BTAD domain-containing putative transcriptional regulator n=1 Tax=unclassified Nocardioides TaxID=2615069 RepID=UPI0036120565
MRAEHVALVPPSEAWRIARDHNEHGDARLALRVLDRAPSWSGRAGERPDADLAMTEAARAVAHWRLGRSGPALAHADAAYHIATDVDDDGALASAHVALALAHSLSGEPDDVSEHYRRAAAHAAGAGDRYLMARIDANLSHHLLADARYAEAAETAGAAAEAAADLAAPALELVALENEAEALTRLGRYDDAVDRCQRELALADRVGTARVVGALLGLSRVHARRGAPEQELADLRGAHRLASGPDTDRGVRTLVLTRLAEVLIPVDLDEARRLAELARADACGSGVLPALIASGRVALAEGDAAAAAEDAARAVAHAGHRRERAWLAEALELRATTDPPPRARVALREAHGIWSGAGATYDGDRVLVRLAALPAAAPEDQMSGRVAVVRWVAEGRPVPAPASVVEIRTFGRLEVQVEGVPVPASAWQSRRARDLLRALVARRGRPVPRLELCEALWPDEQPATTSHRLSVVLSIVRGVLGPDAVVADRDSVALDPGAVRVDVEEFLGDIAAAHGLRRRGSVEEARLLLSDALSRRTDEPFADTPYDDAVLDLRDEAHAAYVQALRAIADLCRTAGDHDEAAAWLRRLLAVEPYDDDAHLTLAAVLTDGGRHGLARRAVDRHRRALAELGLPSVG